MLLGTILNYLFNDGKIDPVEIAQIAQYAENVYLASLRAARSDGKLCQRLCDD